MLFGRGLTNVILVAAFKCFVCVVLITGLSHWLLVVGYALQVFPAVTRLTVYRRLQVSPRLWPLDPNLKKFIMHEKLFLGWAPDP